MIAKTITDLTFPLINTVLIIMIACRNSNENNIHLRGTIGFNPGLHIVVTIAEHACDDVSKRILKLSTYQLRIVLTKYQYLLPD